MRFTVPQFIEHEAKIVGPLTFKQFVFLGVASGVCIFFYFLMAKTNFFLFLILSIFIFGIGLSLAFLKISGRNLPIILINFLRFTSSSKIYLWKEKKTTLTFFKKKEIKKEVKGEEIPLKIIGRSQLKKIRDEIEIQTK